ncbi:hypothetical protein DFQ09_10971 [Winogradskyella pacifica]|uniref:Uncharacterized protein n=1 Tax=Winogradskyella pacifica TaxID=664642 RepID=A0A3D9LMP0_9FLAO|nr:hypothetical protein [Winogradskyella pacifica]REE08010.1 hypothetical protein DFQ09_10971 [Winogradskyella pacifica]
MKSKMRDCFSLKKVLTCLVLLISVVGFSQSKVEDKSVKIDAFSIEVTIDSLEELESTFKAEDLDELLEMMDNNEELSLTLNCSFSEAKDNLEGNMTYTVTGRANEKTKFLKNIEKMKATALKFYNLKNRT